MLAHQPTWDDCRHLLTTDRRDHVRNAAQKQVLGANSLPTQVQANIDAAFPFTQPKWDYNTAEGRGRLQVYHQVRMSGLREAA